MQNSMTYSLPPLVEEAVQSRAVEWTSEHKIDRIWEKDPTVWTGSDEGKWLGWLEIVEHELSELKKYETLKKDIDSAGFTHFLLMGMGGSSLCPEVLAMTFGRENFHILDSTVPAQVIAVEAKLDLAKTLFIVASKSGSTLEPSCFKRYFFDRVSDLVGKENAGRQFVAITDPGSKMEQEARADAFRHIIFGEPTIGGRFSALSPFGMTAAALMGLDVERILSNAAAMSTSCRESEVMQNPAALLGIILGECHSQGRDKLTIFASPDIYDLGAWLEQLIAESTGKNGVAIIPVDREPIQPAVSYGGDRVFVYVKTAGAVDAVDLASLFAAGHPVIKIEIDDIYQIGAEFFRWEFATAVAGSVMGINPFDQPDVESAKIEARKLTDKFEQTGKFPDEESFYNRDGIKLYSSEKYAQVLTDMVEESTLEELLSAHFANVEDGDYFAVLGYIEMNAANEAALQEIRTRVLEKRLAATCLGFGPRFLHSTGQAYKGGANNGVFLQITSDDAQDLPVPGQRFTFGVVKSAQARGDFQVLLDRDRRALRVHLADIKLLDQLPI
jgi:transaldolase/glucose-6-phosphate isomerase